MQFAEHEIRRLINQIDDILNYINRLEEKHSDRIKRVDPRHLQSAKNLVHYLGLRHFDVRPMQEPLAKMGLSSLGRAESHTLANLRAVRYHLYNLLNTDWNFDHHCISLHQARHLLRKNTEALLGAPPAGRSTRIMVTLPKKAVKDRDLVASMIDAGADLFRINCAKDDAETWKKMINQVREASLAAGRNVKVLMDLAGPKLRTTALKNNIPVKEGDELNIYRDQAIVENENTAEIPGFCMSLTQVFEDIKVGEEVLIDDGEIRGRLVANKADVIRVKIEFAETGARIKPDKGINFPETNLSISGLTDKDKQNLEFIARHADVVNMSFIRNRYDVYDLFNALKKLKAPNLGVMLKIETPQAFRRLPQILLTLMQHYPVGIMIARGDLAVESGWERTAEMQEELLWITEAAHIPNVWATQVLEKQAKSGLPSRAEITDAAMGQRSDCVMLNKGPHIVETISMLSDILTRMESHQYKKSPLLRKLDMANDLNLLDHDLIS